MSPPRTRRLRTRAWLAAAVMIATLLVVLWRPGETEGFWGAVEGRLLDLRFVARGPLAPPEGVALIVIDDADMAAFGTYPVPRDALGAAVSRIRAAGAVAVAVDLLLLEDRPGDDRLSTALSDAAVLAVAHGGGAPAGEALAAAISRSGFDAVVDAPPTVLTTPLGPPPSLSGAARLGHVGVPLAPDAALRSLPAGLALMAGGTETWVPVLALAALRAGYPEDAAPLVLRGPDAGGMVEVGAAQVRLDRSGAVPLVYYGPAGTIPTWPLREIDEARLEGRVAFLGISATGAGDRHPTPFDAALPGVEVHATLAANVLEGRHLRRDRVAWLLGGLLALAASLTSFAAATARPARAALVLPLTLGLSAAGLQAAFLSGWWLDAVTVALAAAVGLLAGTAYQVARQSRRAANLARYQSPQLVEALARSDRPSFDGRRQQAIAVFADVAGFTTMSEAMGPDGTATFLHDFHDRVERLAARHGGVVDQFAGDGAMVTFGLPEPSPDDAARALGFVEDLICANGPALRVGAHSGPVQASVLGGAHHRHLTIAGDAVNAASRLQEVARQERARIAVSDALLQQSGAAPHWTRRLKLRDMGLVTLRGRDMRLHVWTDGDAG